MGPNYHPELPRQLNEIRRQLLQHDVDIKRLWQLLQPKGEGWPIGGTGEPASLLGPWSEYEELGGTGCEGANAIIVVTLFGPPTSGTWGLSSWTVNGSSASVTSLAYNLTASTLQTALEGHTGIGSGNVAVTGGPGHQANFIIEFTGALANTPVATPVVSFSGLGGTGVGGLAYPVQIGRAA